MTWHRTDECSRRLARIPGVGPIGASMLVMKTPAPQEFRSARHFAAWLGLTPKDHSTAGKVRLGGITRAGDEALRSVLVTGATAVIKQAQRGRVASPWLVVRIPLILISHSGRSRSPIPVILITLFTMPEEGTADSMTWRWTATTDG